MPVGVLGNSCRSSASPGEPLAVTLYTQEEDLGALQFVPRFGDQFGTLRLHHFFPFEKTSLKI